MSASNSEDLLGHKKVLISNILNRCESFFDDFEDAPSLNSLSQMLPLEKEKMVPVDLNSLPVFWLYDPFSIQSYLNASYC